MKSNFIKSFLVLWLLALTVSTQHWVSARSFVNENNNVKPCFSTRYWAHNSSDGVFNQISTNYSDTNDFNFFSNRLYYTMSNGSDVVSWYLSSFNDWDYWTCSEYWSESRVYNYYQYTNYNFINVIKNSDIANFYVWSEDSLSYRHITTPSIWYSEVIDWDTVVFDMRFPRHWTIVLYSSDTKHTIQIIWDKTLYDLVVYIDTLDTYHNFYVISFIKNKAWSMKFDDLDLLSYYMFWGWASNETFFNNLEDKLTTSYTLTGWGSFFRPQTAWQWYKHIQNWDYYHYYYSTENSYYWLTNAYVSDFKFEKPDFWFVEDVESWFSDNSYSDYVDCKNHYSNISNWANSEYLCRNDVDKWYITTWYFENLFTAIYNYSWVESILWQTRNCQDWLDYSVMAYYDSDLWNESLTWYRENLLIADRNSWSINMLNVDNYCTYEIPVSTGVVVPYSLWSCVAAHLWLYWMVNTNDYCNTDIWGSDTTWKEVDNVIIQVQKSVARPFFQVYDQIEASFMSWYNEVKWIAWYDLSCDSDVYWKSYYWWNVAVIWICAWLVFIFIWLL